MSVLSNGTLTCDGNGDGQIAPIPSVGAWSNYELAHFWVQLSAANLFPGTYNGWADPSYNTGTPGVNFPTTMIGSNNGLQLMNGAAYYPVSGGFSGMPNRWNLDINAHFFEVGAMNGGRTNWAWLSASDAFMLDTKIDDGLPATGRLMAWTPWYPTTTPSSNPTSNNCTTVATNPPSYESGTSIECNFIWAAGF